MSQTPAKHEDYNLNKPVGDFKRCWYHYVVSH